MGVLDEVPVAEATGFYYVRYWKERKYIMDTDSGHIKQNDSYPPRYIGDKTYEIDQSIPFSEWSRIIMKDVPYHFKTVNYNEWTDEDYEERGNANLRLYIISILLDKGEQNWSVDDYKWKEIARRGVNLYRFTGNPIELID